MALVFVTAAHPNIWGWEKSGSDSHQWLGFFKETFTITYSLVPSSVKEAT